MANSPAEHLMAIIIAAAIPGVAIGGTTWRLAAGRLTDSPDTQICLYDSPGEHPSSKWLLDYPYCQVLVRGAPDGYSDARQMVSNIYDVLLGAFPRAMGNGDNIDAITVVGTPSFIGSDIKNRPTISTNYRIILEPVASSYTNREPL